MINRALYALANRSQDFVTPRFNYQGGPFPSVLSSELLALRQKLFLEVTDTDYYLQMFLALLAGYPDVTREFPDPVTTYNSSDFKPAGSTVAGGSWVLPASGLAPVLDPPVVTLPVPRTYQLISQGGTQAEGRCVETGWREPFAVISAPIPGQGFSLTVEWPESWPFRGTLITPSWQLGSALWLQVNPSRFPWALWNNIAGNDPTFLNLLTPNNLLGAWYGADVPEARAAIALLALMQANPGAAA